MLPFDENVSIGIGEEHGEQHRQIPFPIHRSPSVQQTVPLLKGLYGCRI